MHKPPPNDKPPDARSAPLDGGARRADDAAFAQIYEDLRRIAGLMLARERGTHTLQATAVVHEAFMRLDASHALRRFDESALLAIAARVIRQVLVDHARRRKTRRRSTERALSASRQDAARHGSAGTGSEGLESVDLDRLDRALDELRAIAPRAAEVVELRYFGDIPMARIAEILGCARSTVQADWLFARAMLLRRLGDHDA
jgi:RNA polymerase sigma factor (TIGR02999 family)